MRSHAIRCFPPTPESVGDARDFIRKFLHTADVSAEVADAVVLCADELATNAMRHVRRPYTVDCSTDDEYLSIRVHDPSPVMLVEREPSDDDPGGRGLMLVRAFAALSAHPNPRGKVVVARIKKVQGP